MYNRGQIWVRPTLKAPGTFLLTIIRSNNSAFKGIGPSKIIIRIKPYLVKSNGELLIVRNIVRNSPL